MSNIDFEMEIWMLSSVVRPGDIDFANAIILKIIEERRQLYAQVTDLQIQSTAQLMAARKGAFETAIRALRELSK